MSRIEAIKSRLKAIKSFNVEGRAPWSYDNNMIWGSDGDAIINYNFEKDRPYFDIEHGKFIANAPNDIEYLLDRLEVYIEIFDKKSLNSKPTELMRNNE